MEIHFSQRVIVLIDEYDVPLAKAYEHGYYDEMVLLMRNLFGNVLKTNESLAFAVLTGCLRIAKESIFTGLNNFKVYSITDIAFDEAFGFTNDEVREMLRYYNLENYFVDSIDDPGMLTKTELENLVNGDTVVKYVDEMVTYKELYLNIDNLWSTLFMTGYLTQREKESDGRYHLAIPNQEIRNIFVKRVLTLFGKNVSENGELLRSFCTAMLASDARTVERLLTEYMSKTVSIRDSFVKSLRENFYHGLLIGIFGYRDGWKATSNKESGDGFSDILIEANENGSKIGIVIELKYSKTEKGLDKDCREALQQIDDKNYMQELQRKGCQKILKYGIAFYHKKCRVLVEHD